MASQYDKTSKGERQQRVRDDSHPVAERQRKSQILAEVVDPFKRDDLETVQRADRDRRCTKREYQRQHSPERLRRHRVSLLHWRGDEEGGNQERDSGRSGGKSAQPVIIFQIGEGVQPEIAEHHEIEVEADK